MRSHAAGQGRSARGARQRGSADAAQQFVPQLEGSQGIYGQTRRFPNLLLPVIGIVVIVLVVFAFTNVIGSCSGPATTEPAEIKVSWDRPAEYSLKPADLLNLQGSSEITAANLAGNDASYMLGSSALSDIKAALATVEQKSPCGFAFVDIQTGRAITHNATQTKYCASAVKAPLVYYALQHPADGEGLTEEERGHAEEAIIWSENEDYFTLCEVYYTEDYRAWLETFGVQAPDAEESYFPEMSARSLGAIWAEIYQYLQTGSEDAKWLSDMFSQTEESYIRDGLKGTGATVLNKAGWITDGETDALVDAGIIRADGREYLMVIITGLPEPEVNPQSRPTAAALVRALYDARGFMAPHLVAAL